MQVILQYVAPNQEDIAIQDAYKKLSFASNDTKEKLIAAYQQHNHMISQLQILSPFVHKITKEILLKSVPGLD